MPARTIVVGVSAGVGITLALAGWGVAEQASRSLVAERVRELELAGRQVRAVANALSLDMGMQRAAATASEGLEAAYSGRWRWVPLAGPFEEGLPAKDRERLARGDQVVQRSGSVVRVLTPLPPAADGQRFLLELADSVDDLTGALSGPIRTLLLADLAGVGAAILISSVLGHHLITRRLRGVAAFVRAVEEGDLDHRLPATGAGELVPLERALNQLCDRLQRANRSLADQAQVAARAADELRRAEHLASVGKLAAGVAHELGTPLNVILVRAKALVRAPSDAGDVARQASIVAEQAERLARIVRQLLDFSRRRPAHLQDVDPAQLARSIVALLEPAARAREVSLRVDLAEAVPSVRADGGQLEQVLTNLVMNAIQASHGGGEVLVRCTMDRVVPPADARPAGAPAQAIDVARLEVSDRGVGIPRENLPRLFEPFFTTKPPGEGTGLGLSVSWGIVREHGGWIAVESQELEGSTFAVLLPLARSVQA